MSWFGYNLFGSYDQRKFTVYMNEGEKEQIEQWVKQYENIETGGDLFGAWIDDRTAVVQFVLGPGKHCRRTSASFFQDIDYLRNAGKYLTQKHGLCNIGQWHSHHRLGLTRPSGGDENTVWGNMPNLGLDRYIVIIATITDGSYRNRELTVNINPYLFEIKNGHKNGVLDGSFDFLKQNSPFRVDKSIQNTVAIGAETTNDVTFYPETETGNAGKRPRENESDKSGTKMPKTEAEDMSHCMTQSLAPNAENFNKTEGEPLEISAGDGTVRNLENVRNENEDGHYNISQGDGTEENLEDVSRKEDEVREQTNIGQSDAIKQNPEDVPNKDEESKQSNISQDEATQKNRNIWNEDEVRELSNIEQGGATNRTPEDVQNKDEESKQAKKNQNIWNEDESQTNQPKFTVYMNEGEKDQIEQWVKQYENIETGGDLFGAWIDDRTAVVQFVLGPGKKCRRTGTSFFQDIDYLRTAGSYLTQKHGLCNIGQWHSHHRLGLTRPSGGDENTVWGNMPNLGLDRYIVIIATITDGSYRNRELTVNINPYLFEIKNGNESGVLHGSFNFLKQNSPFRMDEGIQNEVENGAEGTNPVTTYPETETRNAGKRPRENESEKSAAKIPKTEAEDRSHRMTQSLARNAENEREPEETPAAGDGAGRNPDDVPNENEENGQINVSQGDGTEENLEDVSGNEDEVSELSNVEQGGATDRTPEDVPSKVEKSKQSNTSQDEAKNKDQNISNEDEVNELSNIQKGETTERNPEEYPTLEEESRQFNTAQGDGMEQTPKDVTNENEETETSSIPQEESPNFLKKGVSGQSNIGQEDVSTEDAESRRSSIPRDGFESNVQAEVDSNKNSEMTATSNEGTEMMDVDDDHEEQSLSKGSGKKSQIRDDDGIAFNSEGFKGTHSELSNLPNTDGNQQETPQDNSSIESFDKHGSDKDQVKSNTGLHDEVFGDEQPKTPPNNVSSNQHLEKDSNNTSNHVTSTPPDESNQKHIDAADTNNDQLSKSDVQEHHTQDFLQNDPERTLCNHDDQENKVEGGQCGQSDILQKDSKRDLKQSFDKNSLNHLPTKQDDYNKTDIKGTKNDFEKDEDKTAKDDRELDNNLQKTSKDNLETVETFDKHGGDRDQIEFDTALLGDVLVDELSKIQPNDVSNNQDLKQDLNDMGKHVTSISPDVTNENQTDAMDIFNEQHSTSDTRESHDRVFLQHDPKGNLEDVSGNKDEVSEQTNIGQSEATKQNPEDVPNKVKENQQFNNSQDEATMKNQNIWSEDEVSELSNIQKGETTERNPEEDPTQEEESRQFNTAQGDGMEQTPKDVTNENEETEKSSIPQEESPNFLKKGVSGQSNIGQEDVPTEDPESRRYSIPRDGFESNVQAEVDSNKNSEMTATSNEGTEMMDVDNDHEEQSLSKGSETKSQIRDDDGIAFNSEGFKGTQSELSNLPNTDGNQQATPQDNSSIERFDKHDSDKDQAKSNTGLRDEVFGDEQPKTPPNNVSSNQHLEKDSNNTSNHVTSTPPDESNQKHVDAADTNNDQLSKSDAQEHHKQDFLQNDPERTLYNHDDQENKVEGGQCGQSDILQKDGKRDLKQSFDKNSLNHLPTKQDDNNKTDIKGTNNDFEKDEDKTAMEDRELDINVQKASQDNLESVQTFDKHDGDKDQIEFDTALLGDVLVDELDELDLKQDLNDTGKHVTSISPDVTNENQIDAMDIINEEHATRDTREGHDQVFSQHDPEGKVLTSNEDEKVEADDTHDGCQDGQCRQLDIVQKDTENDLKLNLDKVSLNHFPTKQDDYKTDEEYTKNEKDDDTTAKKDGELDGASADETMPPKSNEGHNSITWNSGFQERIDELEEKENGELNGAQGWDEIKNATEIANITVVKPGKRQSRSIFDSLEEPDEKQELTSNKQMYEENFGTKDGVNTYKENETNNEEKYSQDANQADTKIKTEDGVDTFTENEKKNKVKNSPDNKRSLSDPQSDESNKTIQIEKTGSDTAKNNEVTTENPSTDSPTASEIEIKGDVAVDIDVDQNEMDQITVRRKNKSRKKSQSQDGENEITKRKSKFWKSKTEKKSVNIETDTNEEDRKTELEDRVETTSCSCIFRKFKKKKAHMENDDNIEKTTTQELKVKTKTSGEKMKEKKSSEKKDDKKEKKGDKEEKKKDKKEKKGDKEEKKADKNEKKGDKEEKKKDKKETKKEKKEKKEDKKRGAEKMEIGEKEKHES